MELSRLKTAFEGHAGSADALGSAFHDMGRILRGVAGAPVVRRFGRFPHRNAALGRVSTPEEAEFLKQPGSGF